MIRHEGRKGAATRKSSLDEQCWEETEVRGRNPAGKSLHRGEVSRRTTESEVFDDGTNTFFW